MPKIRISHYITKKIPISKENSSSDSVKESEPVQTKENFQDKPKTNDFLKLQLPLKGQKKTLAAPSFESRYAFTPKKQTSHLLEDKIREEAIVFREIANRPKKKRTVVPVNWIEKK